MKSILDRSFKYIPSHETNLRITFARVRREMEREKQAQQERAQVVQIKRKS